MKKLTMKQVRVVTLIVAILTCLSIVNKLNAQRKISLAVYQDAKLAVIGDEERGYSALTPDILVKFKMQGHQKETGFLVISPIFEYAEIEGIYKRYGFDIGFTYNNSIVSGLEFTPSVNYGIQDRWSKNWMVFGVDFELGYRINDNIKINALAQFVERKDLKWAYGNYVIRFSYLTGIEFNL